MRVISGLVKGHKLKTLDGIDVRPTLDRVKESLFSILYPYIEDAEVLDLFAGSGALGIEALSRGAKWCDFIDKSKKSYDCIIENLKHTKLYEYSGVHLCDAQTFLKGNSKKFNLVLLDPPYSKGFEDEVFKEISNNLSKDGIVVLESEVEANDYKGFTVIKKAKYGRVYITIFKKEEC